MNKGLFIIVLLLIATSCTTRSRSISSSEKITPIPVNYHCDEFKYNKRHR